MTPGGRSGGRIGAALRGMSLRARLLLVLAVLSAAGLVAADIATYAALRSSLFKRVDSSLDTSANGVAGALASDRGGPGGAQAEIYRLARLGVVSPGMYIEIRPANGPPLLQGTLTRQGEKAGTPKIPTGFAPQSDGGARRATVGAARGGQSFRLLARSLPFADATLVLGAPLHETYVTLKQLKWIMLLVACAVIASALLLGVWLITASLRPLARMEETAAAIGAGDLSRRVEPAGGNTEIGRLGASLNAMLGQIEDAFAERSASEARLRRFISDASHELRTPIAAVSAYAELFDRGARDRPDDLERAMAGIQRESRRIGVLVSDLLLLARLDQGRPLESRPTDLSSLAGEAVDAARAMEPGRTLTLDAPATVTVSGDPERLRQVIDNLLANVRAHTPAGATATVRVRSEAGAAIVEVEDAGPGLSAEQAAHVFDRFYRGDPARSRDHGGAGLGLAIVAAIVEAHGGTVAVETSPGSGTTFRVELPDQPPSGIRMIEPAPAGSDPHGGGLTPDVQA